MTGTEFADWVGSIARDHDVGTIAVDVRLAEHCTLVTFTRGDSSAQVRLSDHELMRDPDGCLERLDAAAAGLPR